jgi:ring-1,2-phenylacetyl-CoA epoxidase subunit PaaE
VPLDPQNAKQYLLFAAGSGITPVMSIIKSILCIEPQSHVSLLYGNQSTEDTIFLEELLALKNKYLQQFQIHFILSREDMEEPLFCGRIGKEKLDAFNTRLFDIDEIDEFMICGPEEMNLEIRESLLAKGIPAKKIHMELFGISIARHRTILSGNPGQSHVKVTADGRSFEFELGYSGISLLDAALKYSKALPFACKGGVCCTCKAKLVKGQVEMDVNYGLEPDEVANGYILTCQSHPRTPEVIIDYDK